MYEPLAGHAVQPAEAESVVGDVQPCDCLASARTSLSRATSVPPSMRSMSAPHRGAVSVLHTRAFSVQPRVQPVDVALLGAELVVVVLS